MPFLVTDHSIGVQPPRSLRTSVGPPDRTAARYCSQRSSSRKRLRCIFALDRVDASRSALTASQPFGTRAAGSSSWESGVPLATRHMPERLPKDLRHRGLCADGQRVRAHGARQRRGVGLDIRRVVARLPVGGGTTESWSSRSAGATETRISRTISCEPSNSALDRRSSIFGIVGRDGGFTAEVADCSVVIPPLYADHVTPHTEGLCAVVWHLLVSHPALARTPTKWESV